jgi:hypothetical protein
MPRLEVSFLLGIRVAYWVIIICVGIYFWHDILNNELPKKCVLTVQVFFCFCLSMLHPSYFFFRLYALFHSRKMLHLLYVVSY